MGNKPRVLIIGLDCAEPSLLFGPWKDDLPNLTSLAASGLWGELESCVPAITVPAWMSMVTSKQPGQLGIYGFRNRADYSYDRMYPVTSRNITEDTIWDILTRHDRPSIVIGVPPTFPLKPRKGAAISCFVTPSTDRGYTYPHELRDEVEALVGQYLLDVRPYRTDDKERLLSKIYEMTEKRFKVANHWIRTKPWDFFMLMEVGVDRIHHGFWKYMDMEHPEYDPGHRYVNAIRDYYRFLDERIGVMLEAIDDDTAVMIVSDHGAKRKYGGILFNEWLRREGYLVLAEDPAVPTRFEDVKVDWSKTRAWAAGGFYGRLFLNVQGREPQGVIPPSQVEVVRDEIAAKLALLEDEAGNRLGAVAFKPEELYLEVKNIAPDLMVYFADLDWMSMGGLGYDSIYEYKSDIGPDDANHAQMGTLIFKDPRGGGCRRASGAQIYDVAPTVLNVLGIEVPRDMVGQDLGNR